MKTRVSLEQELDNGEFLTIQLEERSNDFQITWIVPPRGLLLNGVLPRSFAPDTRSTEQQ